MCREESKGVIAYSPNKVVTAREYLRTKDARGLVEAKAKEQKKLQRASKCLHRTSNIGGVMLRLRPTPFEGALVVPNIGWEGPGNHQPAG